MPPWSLLFAGLNNPKSLSPCSEERCSSPLEVLCACLLSQFHFILGSPLNVLELPGCSSCQGFVTRDWWSLLFYLLFLVPTGTVAGSRQWVGLLQVLLTSFRFVYFPQKMDSARCRHGMSCLHSQSHLIHISSERKCCCIACVYGCLCVSALFKYSHFPDTWVGQAGL